MNLLKMIVIFAYATMLAPFSVLAPLDGIRSVTLAFSQSSKNHSDSVRDKILDFASASFPNHPLALSPPLIIETLDVSASKDSPPPARPFISLLPPSPSPSLPPPLIIISGPNVVSSSFTPDILRPFRFHARARARARAVAPSPPLTLPKKCAKTSSNALPSSSLVQVNITMVDQGDNLPVKLELPNMTYHHAPPTSLPPAAPQESSAPGQESRQMSFDLLRSWILKKKLPTTNVLPNNPSAFLWKYLIDALPITKMKHNIDDCNDFTYKMQIMIPRSLIDRILVLCRHTFVLPSSWNVHIVCHYRNCQDIVISFAALLRSIIGKQVVSKMDPIDWTLLRDIFPSIRKLLIVALLSLACLIEVKMLRGIFKTFRFKKRTVTIQAVPKQAFTSSLAPFIKRNGTLRIKIAPAAGNPSQGFEAIMIRMGTTCSKATTNSSISRRPPYRHCNKVRKRFNRNENNVAYINLGFLFVHNRQKYKQMMPHPLPTIQEETGDDYEHSHDQEVVFEMSCLGLINEPLEEEADTFPSMHLCHEGISDHCDELSSEPEKVETVPDPCLPPAKAKKLGSGIRVDEKGRLIRFSYRLQERDMPRKT